MDKLKRKFFLGSLGAVTALTPAVSVLACDSTNLDYNLVTLNSDIKTPAVKDYVLGFYHGLLLNRIYAMPEGTDWNQWSTIANNTAIKNMLDFFVRQNVYKNHAYIRTLKTQLLQLINPDTSKKFTAQEANQLGFDIYIGDDGFLNFDSAKITAFERVLYAQNVNFFRNEFAKFLVTTNYLKISRTNWRAVFQNTADNANYHTLSASESWLADTDFVLGLKALSLKLFFTWNVTLTEEDSLAFVTRNKMQAQEVDTTLISHQDPASIYNALNSIDQNKVLSQHIVDATNSILRTALADAYPVPGFAGLVPRHATASGSLSFSNDDLKAANTANAYLRSYVGFLVQDRIFDPTQPTAKINIFGDNASNQVKITKLIGIMPMFVNSQLTMEGVIDPELFAQLVYFENDKDSYDEALTYYTSKNNLQFPGGVRLSVTDLPNEEFRTKVVADSFALGRLIDK